MSSPINALVSALCACDPTLNAVRYEVTGDLTSDSPQEEDSGQSPSSDQEGDDVFSHVAAPTEVGASCFLAAHGGLKTNK